jgi:cell division protein FtsQ
MDKLFLTFENDYTKKSVVRRSHSSYGGEGMEKGKIVALEERIPKLKQQRRRKANRRLIFLLFLFFSLIAMVVYVKSPLSHVKNIIVKGNEEYSNNEIIEKTGITSENNIWQIKSQVIEAKLVQLKEIKKASIKVHWPNSVIIQVKEHKRIAYLKKDALFYPVLDNGTILSNGQSNLPINAPVLIDFKEGTVLRDMVIELKKLPEEILNSISEIHYTPYKTDNYHISSYMNDGFEVSATIRSYSNKMSHYPSIISQLDLNKKGIIDLEVGSFFKAYPSEGEVNNEKDKGKR